MTRDSISNSIYTVPRILPSPLKLVNRRALGPRGAYRGSKGTQEKHLGLGERTGEHTCMGGAYVYGESTQGPNKGNI